MSNKILLHSLLVLIGASLPLIIDKAVISRREPDFRLIDLSKILFALVITYLGYYFINAVFSIGINSFFSYLLFKVIVTIVLVTGFLINVPISATLVKVTSDYRINILSFPYLMLVIFFSYLSGMTALAVYYSPMRVAQNQEFQIILSAVIDMPLLTLLLLAIINLATVVSEELVFRYCAVNALRSRLGKKQTIFISALIWTLLHWDISLTLFVVGVFLAYFYLVTESLIFSSILHFLYNMVAYSQIAYLTRNNFNMTWLTQLGYFFFLILFLLAIYHVFDALIHRWFQMTESWLKKTTSSK